MQTLEIEAIVENLDTVTAFVDEQLEAAECTMKLQTKINIAVEEIFVNIASYAYDGKAGNVFISVEITEDRLARIAFQDSGTPYDPLAHPDPDVSLPANERGVGGLGIYMVKKIMDNICYDRKGGRNILVIEKRLNE